MLDGAWNSFKETINRISTKATERIQELEPLIHYFEHEMLIVSFSAISHLAGQQVRQISDDIQKLDHVSEEFRQVSAEVESIITTGNLIQLFSMSGKLDYFHTQIKTLEYLATLSEDDLLEKYYPSLLGDNTSPFSNFTQDHRDGYTRLKFRAMNKRNSQQHSHQNFLPAEDKVGVLTQLSMPIDSTSTTNLISSLEQKIAQLAQRLSKQEIDFKKSVIESMDTLSLKVTGM